MTVDVFAYNSKVFYIITEGAGFGDNVVRRPITGNETVLDAVSDIGGLSQLSSKKMWISRPAPGNIGCEQILPINWDELTRGAVTTTNYQLLPGDRLFVAEDKFVKLDSIVAKLTRPFWITTAPSCSGEAGAKIEMSSSLLTPASSGTPASIWSSSPVLRSSTISAPVRRPESV